MLSTLATTGVHIISDELNHASIIDGCRLARANGAITHVVAHLDLDACERLLEAHRDSRCIVVTDVVFSMDGDTADVPALIDLCRRHDALLLLDEAHSVLEELPVSDPDGPPVVQVGTLSKTLGALGGFVAAPRAIVDLLVNRARTYIFTTAPSPADSAAALAAIGVLQSTEGEALRSRLRDHVEHIRPGHRSPIIPIVLGEESTAVAASLALLERGLLVPAIRPPTVAPGTSRLRVALSAIHTDEQIEQLAAALDTLTTQLTPEGSA